MSYGVRVLLAAASAVALALAPEAHAIGPEVIDSVLQEPASLSRIVGIELQASRTLKAPSTAVRVSEPSCVDFADVGLSQVFNGNEGTLVAYRGTSSQKSASDARYSVKQAVGCSTARWRRSIQWWRCCSCRTVTGIRSRSPMIKVQRTLGHSRREAPATGSRLVDDQYRQRSHLLYRDAGATRGHAPGEGVLARDAERAATRIADAMEAGV